MKKALVTIALLAAAGGALLWTPALGIQEPPTAVAALSLAPAALPAGLHATEHEDLPAPWTLVLIGAAVLAFVATRRLD